MADDWLKTMDPKQVELWKKHLVAFCREKRWIPQNKIPESFNPDFVLKNITEVPDYFLGLQDFVYHEEAATHGPLADLNGETEEFDDGSVDGGDDEFKVTEDEYSPVSNQSYLPAAPTTDEKKTRAKATPKRMGAPKLKSGAKPKVVSNAKRAPNPNRPKNYFSRGRVVAVVLHAVNAGTYPPHIAELVPSHKTQEDGTWVMKTENELQADLERLSTKVRRDLTFWAKEAHPH